MSLGIHIKEHIAIGIDGLEEPIKELVEKTTPKVAASLQLRGPSGKGVPKGGTADQVLVKLSNGDYDTGWTDAGGGGGHTIQDEGTPLTQRTNLNFIGAGVAATDNAGNDATDVTITATPGGSDTQVQYNNGGAFGGTAAMTFDDAATAEVATFAGSPTASSGTAYGLKITPDFSGITGTGGYTGLFVNATDGSGSGTELLADLQIGGSSKFIVEASGKVGIGVTPTSELHIKSSGNPYITIDDATNKAYFGLNNGDVLIQAGTNGKNIGF